MWSESFSKQAKRVAFSENLEELKEFLQLIGSNLVLTGPIDDDHPAVAGSEEARESQSLEKKQVGNFSRHDARQAEGMGDGRPVGVSILKKTFEIPPARLVMRSISGGSLPVHVPILGTSTFCLPEKQTRAVTVGGGASRINRRRLPVVCVRFPKPFQFIAHSAKNSNWRASLMYARTINDPNYTPDTDHFKLNVVYIAARFAS